MVLLITLTEIFSLLAVWRIWGLRGLLLIAVVGIGLWIVIYRTDAQSRKGEASLVAGILFLIAVPTAGTLGLLLTGRWFSAGLLVTLTVFSLVLTVFAFITDRKGEER